MTLSQPMADHLKCVESFAWTALNCLRAGYPDEARRNLETVIASLREAQASLAHDREIEEARAHLHHEGRQP